jgi:hypothetical protein
VPVVPGPAAAAATPPTPAPAVTGTLHDYLQAKGVKLEAQKAQGFKALDITLPVPGRWTQVPDPNVPDAFAVIADRLGASLYTSNAQVVVYKLVGKFDPKDAITHGFVDSQQLQAWQTTNASQADFGGFPSSIIEGTYRQNDMTLNTSRRHVIATSGSEKYLVSLSVTTALLAGGFRWAGDRRHHQRIPGRRPRGSGPPARAGTECGAGRDPHPGTHGGPGPCSRASGPVQPDVAPAIRAEPVDAGTRTAATAEFQFRAPALTKHQLVINSRTGGPAGGFTAGLVL